jgi:dTDP-4-dehydrorhamnose 3,5-epimerase-like enzyme
MPKSIFLNTIEDHRGKLTILEKILPFSVKRIFFIYDVPAEKKRGGHKHIKTIQALFCIRGACEIHVHDGSKDYHYNMTSPKQGLLLWPEDWHEMYTFSSDAILMVVASEEYDPKDYIIEYHPNHNPITPLFSTKEL